MALWRITPIADEDEPRWLDHPIWREVVVRAPSAAQARVLAADMERRDNAGEPPSGNESHSFSSGFEDEKLYLVSRLDPQEAPDLDEEGPATVVRAVKALEKTSQ